MMLKCFQSNLIKCIVNFEINMENLKKRRKYHIFKKTLSLFIVYIVYNHKYEKNI